MKKSDLINFLSISKKEYDSIMDFLTKKYGIKFSKLSGNYSFNDSDVEMFEKIVQLKRDKKVPYIEAVKTIVHKNEEQNDNTSTPNMEDMVSDILSILKKWEERFTNEEIVQEKRFLFGIKHNFFEY